MKIVTKLCHIHIDTHSIFLTARYVNILIFKPKYKKAFFLPGKTYIDKYITFENKVIMFLSYSHLSYEIIVSRWVRHGLESFVQRLLEMLNSFFYHMACGMLVPWAGIEPLLSAVEMWSPNHWISREFHSLLKKNFFSH